ncbi:MAG TPA: prepilin peptidase [Candidatus Elarobacter sp.]|jgi:prepilin signal peptidase PulO-like enzyme (type II secretory pathway)
MIAAVMIALAALLFGAAGWGGTLVADALCAGRAPFDDGPVPVAFARWPFAVAGACIGVALAAQGASPARLALLVFVMLALAGCCAADLSCGLLPDPLTLVPLIVVAGAGIALHDWAPVVSAAFVFAPFALAATLSRGRGMGWGDAKLAALGGALLGAREAAFAFLLAAVAAAVIARRTTGARRPIAFGPYLAAAIVAMLPLVRNI